MNSNISLNNHTEATSKGIQLGNCGKNFQGKGYIIGNKMVLVGEDNSIKIINYKVKSL